MEYKTSSVIDLLQKAIRAKSVSGSEKEVALLFKKEMERLNYDKAYIDEYGNVIGFIKGNKEGTIAFQGHMDTVGVPDESLWTYPPFSGEIHEGKLYGRGTCDMKSSICAMVEAGGRLAQDKERNFCSFYVIGIVYEEIFEGVSLGKVLDSIKIDALVSGEPSDMNIMIGQKGRAEIVVETKGINAHSAFPEKGKNAIKYMSQFIGKLDEINCPINDVLGKGLMVATDIKSFPYPGSSVIPDLCRLTIDRRLVVGESETSILENIKEAFSELKSSDKEFDGECYLVKDKQQCYTGSFLESNRFFPAWVIEKNHKLVKSLATAIEKSCVNLIYNTYDFCTDGSESAGRRNIPTVGFGPAPSNRAHIVDEFVEVDRVEKCVDVYENLVRIY